MFSKHLVITVNALQDLKELAKVYPRFRAELKGAMPQFWRIPSPVTPIPAITIPNNFATPQHRLLTTRYFEYFGCVKV